MAEYTIYDTETGEILSNNVCQDEALGGIQVSPRQGVYTGNYSRGSYHFVEGGPVAYSEAVAADKLSVPNYPAVWSNSTGTWIDLRTVADLQQAKWAEIKKARSVTEFGGFSWDGSTFDSDATSQSRIQGAAQLATLAVMNSQPFSIDWTLRDNTVRTLDAAAMIAVGTAMGAHISTQHGRSRDLRATIFAATTPAAVEAVVWG